MPRFKESERRKIKSATRAKLLDAALKAFAAHGYERANVDDISKTAGFAKGTVYNYFGSKRAILTALIEEVAADHVGNVTREVTRLEDHSERLRCFFQAGFDWVVNNPARARLLFNTLNGPDLEFRQTMFTAYLPMFEMVGKEILVAGLDAGSFRSLEEGPMAGLLMLIYLGAASQQGPDGRPWVSHELVSDLVLNGLRNMET